MAEAAATDRGWLDPSLARSGLRPSPREGGFKFDILVTSSTRPLLDRVSIILRFRGAGETRQRLVIRGSRSRSRCSTLRAIRRAWRFCPSAISSWAACNLGKLILIDLTSARLARAPDSVAVTTLAGQLVAVIAIENEGALGKGYVEVVRLNLADFANSPSATVTFDDESALGAAGLLAVADPQPEFVSIRGTKVAVTLQENNGIAIIDISNPAAPTLEELFSAGVIANRPADLLDDARISFTDTYPADKLASVPDAGARIPDAIAWSADGSTLFTADEGEANFTGGRGWSAHAPGGAVLFDDEGELEATAVQFGQYPDGRSDAKGIEAESLVIDHYGSREFMFVGSERGAFVAVYRLDGGKPRFVQLLSTGQAPEGLLTIPSRGLFVTANEGDDADGTISIFEGVPGGWNPSADRPGSSRAALTSRGERSRASPPARRIRRCCTSSRRCAAVQHLQHPPERRLCADQ